MIWGCTNYSGYIQQEKETVTISGLGKTDCNTLNTQFYRVKCHLHVVSQSDIVQNLSCLSIFLFTLV